MKQKKSKIFSATKPRASPTLRHPKGFVGYEEAA